MTGVVSTWCQKCLTKHGDLVFVKDKNCGSTVACACRRDGSDLAFEFLLDP